MTKEDREKVKRYIVNKPGVHYIGYYLLKDSERIEYENIVYNTIGYKINLFQDKIKELIYALAEKVYFVVIMIKRPFCKHKHVRRIGSDLVKDSNGEWRMEHKWKCKDCGKRLQTVRW